MNNNSLLKIVVPLAVLIALAVTVFSFRNHPHGTQEPMPLAEEKIKQSPPKVNIQPPPPIVQQTAPVPTNSSSSARASADANPVAAKNQIDASSPIVPSVSGTAPQNKLVDPMARVALAFVGFDPEAEDYWFAAINDPALPANERQDLIEDLNEVGLSDPKHPSPDDLPLILSRLDLLETIYAMDQVNADAMQEAYKDLVNLAALASGTGGQPVK